MKKRQTDFSHEDPRMQPSAAPTQSVEEVPETPPPIFDDVTPKLRELQADARAEGTEDQFMKPKKRGRPKGGKNRPKWEREGQPTSDSPRPLDPERVKMNKDLVTPLWGTISQVGVKLAEDPAAAIGPHEMMILVDTSARCIEQYLPDLLGQHADLIVLTVTFAQWSLRVYTLRSMHLAELRAQRGTTRAPEPELRVN